MFPVADVIPSRSRPYVTIGLIGVNTAAFVVELLLDDALPGAIFTFGLVPAAFSWPDILSSMFLHAGWLPFLGNMLYLWIFGDNVEDRIGRLRYLMFYLACGTAAALGHVAFEPRSVTPAIGASGAISGVMGAYFLMYPRSRVLTAVFPIVFLDLIEVPAVFFLGAWLLLQLFSGVGSIGAYAEGGVAIWAHVIGFATGALGGWMWRGRVTYP